MANVTSIGEVLAVIALRDAESKVAGGVPIFIAENPHEQVKISTILGKILNAMVHDLENGLYIIARH